MLLIARCESVAPICASTKSTVGRKARCSCAPDLLRAANVLGQQLLGYVRRLSAELDKICHV